MELRRYDPKLLKMLKDLFDCHGGGTYEVRMFGSNIKKLNPEMKVVYFKVWMN